MDRQPTDVDEHTSPGRDASGDVLIVEDEQVARRALAFLLLCSGYKPVVYATAEEVLRDVEKNGATRPVVALIDVDLPGMSGPDLAARLEKLRPGMVNVLITAAAGERIDRFLKEHRATYFRKPLDFARLLELLDQTQLHN